MTMTHSDPNEFSATGPDAPNERSDNAGNPETNQPAERPYGDAGSLYDIPRVRPDDPPMRRWWTDDEPQQDGSGSPR